MKLSKKKLCAAVLAAVLSVGVAVGMPDTEAATRAEMGKIVVNRQGSNFIYWNEDSNSFKQLTSYVRDVTNPMSKNFIPVKDRIAVFDFDGTLLCETTPSYFEWMMHLKRALHDPNYTPSAQDREDALQVQKAVESIGVPVPTSNQAQAQASVFSGMDLDEFDNYVKDFMETPAEGLTNLKRGESFYLPMVEVVSYLTSNRFKVFVVSGSDRQAVRVICEDVLPVDSDNIIGTDIKYLAAEQGDTDGLKYTYEKKDKVIRGKFVMKDLQMNKVSNIMREIGKQPVLAFGNSTSDASMLNHAIYNNKYRAMAFGVICDDQVRELGNPKTAEKMTKACEKYGWVTISMRDDWKTIYGDYVKRSK